MCSVPVLFLCFFQVRGGAPLPIFFFSPSNSAFSYAVCIDFYVFSKCVQPCCGIFICNSKQSLISSTDFFLLNIKDPSINYLQNLNVRSQIYSENIATTNISVFSHVRSNTQIIKCLHVIVSARKHKITCSSAFTYGIPIVHIYPFYREKATNLLQV